MVAYIDFYFSNLNGSSPRTPLPQISPQLFRLNKAISQTPKLFSLEQCGSGDCDFLDPFLRQGGHMAHVLLFRSAMPCPHLTSLWAGSVYDISPNALSLSKTLLRTPPWTSWAARRIEKKRVLRRASCHTMQQAARFEGHAYFVSSCHTRQRVELMPDLDVFWP